ncbi:MAG: PilZ domain-containing protein [Candidatus Eremiobacteraeota bacterium]|nr:PilZ domain-containing protein [Candidatus Eremiobacteraeota bacterium]
MTEFSGDPNAGESADKRALGLRLRKYVEVVVEDPLSSMLIRAAVADISETGMRVIADQYLPKGTKYTFTMKRAPFLKLRGEIRWVKASGSDNFQAGVLFVEVGDDERKRLANFLELERKRMTATSG